MAAQPDLFASPAPAGLRQISELITVAEEIALIAFVQTVVLAPFQFQGWTGKRLTASYGWHYDFEGARLAPAAPLPDDLLCLRERAAAFAGLPAADLVQALITRYDPGAGIGWHRDRPVFEHVIGISLGTPATLRLRRRAGVGFERRAIELELRSAYYLSGDARHDWEHSIVPGDTVRWSVTLRTLSTKGQNALRATEAEIRLRVRS